MGKDYTKGMRETFQNSALQKADIFSNDEALAPPKAVRLHKKRLAAVERILADRGMPFSVLARDLIYQWLKQNL